jgi:hypothetical protein
MPEEREVVEEEKEEGEDRGSRLLGSKQQRQGSQVLLLLEYPWDMENMFCSL